MSKHHGRTLRRSQIAALLAASLAATPSLTRADDSRTGSSLALKNTTAVTGTLGGTGFLGTYVTVPAGGATLNFTINATRGAGSGNNPHMNLVIGDTIAGFNVASTSGTNYTTPNVTLPAGTYVVRAERDYPGNVGSAYPFTVNNLSVVGTGVTFSNTSTDTNARNAANTYIDNFRKGSATVALKGPNNIPLLAGTPVQVDLARHAFNFGNAVSGHTSTEVNNYLGTGGTSLQTNYQSRLNQNFNMVVPSNAGKWQNNEFTRDSVTMTNVDTILNYAQSHNMRARMHNLIWGDNSFNGQQPSWVLNNSNNGLLDLALAGNSTAASDLRAEITERIQYYINSTRAPKYVELDVYNESLHTPQYRTAYGFSGIASIYNEAANAAVAAGSIAKMFTNEYNVFQDGGDSFANWYVSEIESIRNAGGNVGGVGMQYYPNTTIGTGNGQHSTARMMVVLNNLSAQGIPISLTEFGVKSGGEAIAPTVLEDSLRLTFGSPRATGFAMWGFYASEGLFAPGSAFYDASWNISDSGKKWQDLLGLVDWDGNPNNAWDTLQNLITDANGNIAISSAFYGDYYLSGQRTDILNAKLMPLDFNLAKGTTSYNTTLARPPGWFLWKTNGSGTWGTASNWTDGPQSNNTPNGAGLTAYFGSSATTYNMGFVNGVPTNAGTGAATTTNITTPVTVTVNSNVTAGMLVFDNANSYTINSSGGAGISLQGYNNASGHVAAIYVNNGNHTINAPVTLLDDTTVTVVNAANTLTVSNLQGSSAALTKAGAGKLHVNNVRGGALSVAGGTLKVLPNGGSAGTSRVASLSIGAGAKLDLSDNKLVIAGGDIGSRNGSEYTGLTGLIQSGRGDGSWNGTTGLLTTMSDATTGVLTTLAIVSADETSYVGGTFGGVTVNSGDVLVMYTWGGDADLNGELNGDDYFWIDSNILAQTPGFHSGDFDYNGEINGDDYFILDSNILQAQASPPFSTGSGAGFSVVPEPGAGLIAGGFALLAAARRRRTRLHAATVPR